MNIYDIKTLTEVFIHNNGGELLERLQGKFGQVGSVVRVKTRLYYLFYKKEWFISFSKFFPKFKGVGTGTSMKFIDLAAANDAVIVFYMKDKEYQISARLVKEFVEKEGTKKFFEADQDWIGNIPATFLERNIISKRTVESQIGEYLE